MPIPRAIRRHHVQAALREIDRDGVPSRRSATKYHLVEGDRRYPPKYVVSIAARIATENVLPSSNFSGGAETNGFLKRLGFTVILAGWASARSARPAPRHEWPARPASADHRGEHCRRCKLTVRRLLERLYGEVAEQVAVDVPAKLEAIVPEDVRSRLEPVHRALVKHRGNRDFVRTTRLPPVDYLVRDPPFVVEYDERQHFTALRGRALDAYGDDLRLGFERKRWRSMCREIDAHDDDPPDRDEQRAWYDSLRDYLPILKPSFGPTVRIRASDFAWCSLDPDRPEHQAFFRERVGLSPATGVTVRVPSTNAPFWGRIVILGPWAGEPGDVRQLLDRVCTAWPRGVRSRILVTCGGFLSFPWPDDLTRREVGDVLRPTPEAVRAVFLAADRAVETLLDTGLRRRLRACTDAITLGVDSFKTQVSTAATTIRDLHTELVYLVDLRNGTIHRTGKSYPTGGQERGLLRVADLKSHFTTFDGLPALLLGCHDLNMFHPRGNAVAKGWRLKVVAAMRRLVRKHAPRFVAHHPHTTDTPQIWRLAKGNLEKLAPSVDAFASAGRYYDAERAQRAPLDEVLGAMVKGESLDFSVAVVR